MIKVRWTTDLLAIFTAVVRLAGATASDQSSPFAQQSLNYSSWAFHDIKGRARDFQYDIRSGSMSK